MNRYGIVLAVARHAQTRQRVMKGKIDEYVNVLDYRLHQHVWEAVNLAAGSLHEALVVAGRVDAMFDKVNDEHPDNHCDTCHCHAAPLLMCDKHPTKVMFYTAGPHSMCQSCYDEADEGSR